MPAGLNRLCRILKFSYPVDDDVGGALPISNITYDNVPCRLRAMKPTQPLLEQGIESTDLFTAILFPGTLNVENNDILQIISPGDIYYNKSFRVIGDPQRTSMSPSDNRGFLLVNLKRIESRGIQ
jgi:hypothetical protein